MSPRHMSAPAVLYENDNSHQMASPIYILTASYYLQYKNRYYI